jgi:hypothetical protein
MSKNKIIVISDSGGLMEQIRDYTFARISKAGDPNSLHASLQEGLQLATELKSKPRSTSSDEKPDPFYSTLLNYLNERVYSIFAV